MKNQYKKILLFAYLLAVSFSANAQITSTFDIDADDWTFFNGSTGASLPGTFNSTGGNPDGFISLTYSSNISTTRQSWIAPLKFYGSQVLRSYGMNFKFDLQQSTAGTATGSNGEVRIESGGNVLVYTLPTKPAVAPAWSSYSIKLDDTGGWRWSSTTGTLATQAQIKQVLTNITGVEIRGTYATNTTYTSGLDNVILEQRTLEQSPVITSITPMSAAPGEVVTIIGSGFDATAANNAVYFGTMRGTVQAGSNTQLSVVVPKGARFGSIGVTNLTTGLSAQLLNKFNPQLFSDGGRIIPATFNPREGFDTGIQPAGFSVADIDGDGWNDLAIANTNNTDIRVYRNKGLGGEISDISFEAPLIFSTGGSGINGAGLNFVDLDGDGKLDAITSAGRGGGSFITFRNMSTPGNIAFEASEAWTSLSDEANPAVIIDLDGDGRPELTGGESSSSNTSFNYFWANQNLSTPGNIDFASAITFFNGTVINAFSGATAGDLNGDGKPELVVSHNFGDRFTVLKNNSTPGRPSFANSFTIVTGQYNRSMHVIDVNLDGKNDLVWKRGASIYFRINTNNGGALADTDFATEIIMTSDLGTDGGISFADVNGDNKPDLVSTDNSDIGVYENIFSGGVFSANSYISAYQLQGGGTTSYPSSPIVADLNGDGKADLTFATTNNNSVPFRISLFQNNNVSAPRISVNTVSPLAAPVGATITITGSDFSPVAEENNVYFGAVKAEVLSATANQLTVTVPAGATYAPVSVRKGELTSRYRLPFSTKFSSGVIFDNTHFAPPVNFTLTNANYDIEVGDLNNDGKPDILAEANGGFAFRNTHVAGAINTSSLLADDTLSVNSFINPRIEDFDGDGFLDVASVNGLAHRNISTSAEISFQPSITTGLGASNMDMADFNDDGKTDFVVTTDLSGAGDLVLRENRSIAGVFTNTGTYGTFSSNFIYNKPAPTGGVVAEDFDGDGFADVATTNPGTDNISIYRNLGILKVSAAQFATRIDLAVGDNPGRIYKGDFDNDGKVDLLVYHSTGTTTTLLTVFQNTSTVGNISFSRTDLTNPSATTVAAVADLDGDGKAEIITTSETGNRFSIFKNIHTSGALSASSFATPFNTTVTAPRGLAIGDLNLDGKPEIIITRAAGLLVVYENLVGNPSITSFNPSSGPVGTTVTITGANFSSTLASNIVRFNGIAAEVTASTATSITTTVPAGATTGIISVTVSEATGISSTAFTVTSPVLTPGLVWARAHIGSTDTFSEDVTTDAAGNVYTTGSFDQTTDFDPGPGVLNLTSAGNADIYVSKLNANGDLAWAFSLGSITSDAGTGIDTDATGNVYVSGSFSGTVDFDPGPGTTNLIGGGKFLCKFDPNGNLISAFALPGTLSFDIPLAVDAADNLYLAGSFSGTADFDPGAGVFNMTSAGSSDIFVLKLSSAGTFIWAKRMGSTLLDGANALTLDATGSAYITGSFNGTVDFDPGAGTANLTSAGATDIFVQKLDNAGNYLWARRVGGTSALDTGNGIALDRDNNLLITGRFDGTVDFDPGAGVDNLTSAGGGDAYVLKLTSAGNFVWAKSMGGPFGDAGIDIVCDAFDNVYSTGDLRSNTADFDPGPGTFNLSPTGSWEVYLSGLDAAGNFMWAIASQGAAGSSVYQPELSLDAGGNIILIGVIEDAPADLDPGICVTNVSPNGVAAFITKLRPGTINTCGPLITINPQPASTFACVGSSATFTTGATGTTNILFQWQYSIDGTSFSDIVNNANYTGATTPTLSVSVTGLAVAGFYRCKINGDAATTVFSFAAQLTVNTLPAAPTITDGFNCGPGSVVLSALGGTDGEYRWYTLASGGSAITGEVSATYSTPSLISSTNYYVSINNGNCESARVEVKATILTPPTAPTTTAGSNCGSGTVTLQAAGATNGQYRWYDVPTGGTALAGETNNSFKTPVLTATTTYYVSINNGSCESTRTAANAVILLIPIKPTITSSEPISAGVVELCLNAITLSAPSGFTYTWSNGQSTQQITVVEPGNYSVVVKDVSGCSSVVSDIIQVVANTSCVNSPPVINTTTVITTTGGFISIDLSGLISDPDNNLDPSSLQVVGNATERGGKTTLSGFILDLDYSSIAFSGSDLVTLRICDQLGVCIEREFAIEVIGEIVIYNGISPNGDGKNDSWIIEYINLFPDTQKNKVTIYNRWGDLVWEASDYDNTNVAFTGLNKNGNELSSGSYFYKIEFQGGRESMTGYISLKR